LEIHTRHRSRIRSFRNSAAVLTEHPFGDTHLIGVVLGAERNYRLRKAARPADPVADI